MSSFVMTNELALHSDFFLAELAVESRLDITTTASSYNLTL